MAKKCRNLIGQIAARENIQRAYERTAAGKRLSIGHLEFKEYAPLNLSRLADDLASGNYRPGEPSQFTVLDPKPRLITVVPFRDRVAHHAIVGVIGPIFEATFLPRSYACRPGLGTHAGVRSVQAEMRHLGAPLYALKTDYSKYFASIDRAILHRMIERKVSCAATLDLLRTIIPPIGVGLPIGSLTSQLFANVYGSAVDRFVHCSLGVRHWHRYMDDIVILGHEARELREIQKAIAAFSEQELRLRLSKWSVQSVDRGVNFLGYRIWPTHKLLRRQSVTRARRKLKVLRERGDLDALQAFVAAWRGHAQWADSHNLLVDFKLRSGQC